MEPALLTDLRVSMQSHPHRQSNNNAQQNLLQSGLQSSALDVKGTYPNPRVCICSFGVFALKMQDICFHDGVLYFVALKEQHALLREHTVVVRLSNRSATKFRRFVTISMIGLHS